jgi:transcriptional regulator GlxA family with amidase domain
MAATGRFGVKSGADPLVANSERRNMYRTYAGDGQEPIGFLLVPQFSMMALMSAIEPLRVANRLAARPVFSWRTYSVDGEAAESSNGMKVVVGGSAQTLAADPPPTLFVCAGFEPERYETKALLALLRRLARAQVIVAALDTGAHILAKARLLSGARVTMHWEAASAFAEEFPDITVTDELFEVDAARITCAGGTAAMDLMLDMISTKHGAALAIAVSEQFMHARIRDRGERQRPATAYRLRTTDRRLVKTVELMERHLDEPVEVEDLAAKARLSTRQIERLFRRHLRTTPTLYYLKLLLERARQLLRQTDMSVVDVGAACGFASASCLSRSYKVHFGIAPSRDRSEPWMAHRNGLGEAAIVRTD